MNPSFLRHRVMPIQQLRNGVSRILLGTLLTVNVGMSGVRSEEAKLPDRIALPRLVDVTGKEHTFERTDPAPVVLAWTAGDCPMAKVYAPRLRALATELAPRGVRFFLIDSSSDATADKLRAAAPDHVPMICDERGELARLAGARSTDGGPRARSRGADRLPRRRGRSIWIPARRRAGSGHFPKRGAGAAALA